MPTLAVLALLATAAAAPFSGARHAYLYQHAGQADGGTVLLALETAYGTRDARSLGPDGLETGLRGRLAPHERVTLEAFGGMLLAGGGERVLGAAVDGYVSVLDEAHSGVDLTFGAGFARDYRRANVPRLRASVARSFGAVHLAVPFSAEIPIPSAGAPERDEADISFGLVGSWGTSPLWRVGLEALAEDVEGFWDPEEAEGGARLLFGPTAFWAPGPWRIALNTAGVLLAGPAVANPDVGILGRLSVGYAR